MAVHLRSLRIRRYRGIGSDWAVMSALSSFNFFIGPNNSGKSSVLNFIHDYLPLNSGGPSGKKVTVPPLDKHFGGAKGPPEVGFAFEWSRIKEELVDQVLPMRASTARSLLNKLEEVFSKDNLIWYDTKIPFEQQLVTNPLVENIKPLLTDAEWSQLWVSLQTQRTGGNVDQHWIPDVTKLIGIRFSHDIPTTRLIPAIRQVGSHGEQFGDYSGRGIIDQLVRIQSPNHDARPDRQKFDKINFFLRSVTGNPDATIEIPHGREHILVHMNDRVLPLSSLGTGIHELIMLATFCTLSENEIICMEEPELHLHPLLQRKLVSYLRDNTSNQYFIATHSAAFIDTPGASIFHVKFEGGETKLRPATLKKQIFDICTDLGHRASDIAQSNAVIWVEGPSDRIYIKHWLRFVDDSLLEGVSYSIMFYGGRLLSHLSTGDQEVTEFIELRALNQHMAIVIDSDKSSSATQLNGTKRRIKEEMVGSKGVVWITKGREIENYIPHSVLQEAVKEVYSEIYSGPSSGSIYDHALYFERKIPKRRKLSGTSESIERVVDKVKVARKICESEADLSVLDLKDRVQELAEFIRQANR